MEENIQKESINYSMIGIIILAIIIFAGGSTFLYFRYTQTPSPENGNDNGTGALPLGTQPYYPPSSGNGNITPPPLNNGNTNNNNTNTTTPPTGPTVSVKTQDGKMIEVKNFYANAVETMHGYVVIKETSYYRLIFYETDNSFLINITNSNVPTARAVAELELPDIFGIQQQQICRLIISIGVSIHVSEKYGGKIYGLSYCPGGETF